MISILLLLATLIQGTSMVTDKAWTCVMPAEANLSNPLFVPLSTRVLKSEVLPFDLTLFNLTPMPATDVEPQLIVATADVHYFFVALSVAAAVTAVIVAAVLLIFMFFMFAAFLFTKKNQKPRKTRKNNKREKECGTCCDCCFVYLWPEQMVPPSTAIEVLQVVAEEEVLPEVEAPTEIVHAAPPPTSQPHQPPLQLQQPPPLTTQQQQQTPLQSNQTLPLPTQEQQPPLPSPQTPPPPTQPHQSPPQLRRSSRLAGKPPVDFRPFF